MHSDDEKCKNIWQEGGRHIGTRKYELILIWIVNKQDL